MNTVQSKYKNPDKYIESLKKDLRLALRFLCWARSQFDEAAKMLDFKMLSLPPANPAERMKRDKLKENR